MSDSLNRRNFHQLALAAFSGVVAGSLSGCPASKEPVAPAGGAGSTPEATETVSIWLQEPHVCRGLNSCKNLGATKDNECAGQGNCATVAAHACGGQNECKGQGGCGANPGENSCKTKGLCGVPLEHAWDSARRNFETAMTAAGKEFGAAPAALAN